MNLRALLCLSIAPLFAGCGKDYATSLQAGEVVVHENRQEISRQPLSPDQLQSLSQWFEQHRSGWHGMIAPASSEPAPLQLSLKHTDGKSTLISVGVQADGRRYLRLTSSDKWAYRSFGGMFKSKAALRGISDAEFQELQHLLRVTG